MLTARRPLMNRVRPDPRAEPTPRSSRDPSPDAGGATGGGTLRGRWGATRRILVAEPNPIHRRLLLRLLERLGHDVTEAADLGAAWQAPSGPAFDIVVVAPRFLDDPAAMGRIRRSTAHLLVLGPPGGLESASSTEFDGVIPRPIRPASLFEALDRLGDPTGRPVASGSTAMEALLGSDPDFLAEVITLFGEGAPRLSAALRDALGRRDAAALARAAHALKGMLGHFGESPALGLARQLEDRGRTADLDAAGPLVDALDEELPRLRDRLGRP